LPIHLTLRLANQLKAGLVTALNVLILKNTTQLLTHPHFQSITSISSSEF